MESGFGWADGFDQEILFAIESKQHEKLIDFRSIDSSRYAVPTFEHFAPLLVAAGAGGEDSNTEVFNAYRELGSISMTSFLWR